MIGQLELQKHIEKLLAANRLPRFLMLIGAVGSGRKTVAHWIAQKAGMECVLVEHNITSIRNAVTQAYDVTMPTMYLIADANTLSNIAQNTLLKVTEEPPNSAYFILTVSATSDVLMTLVNRSYRIILDAYSEQELREYLKQSYGDRSNDYPIALDICKTMGEIDQLFAYDVNEFMSYVDKVIDNVAVVSGANSFKIAKGISFKEDGSGYDVALFLKAFMMECLHRMIDDDVLHYAKGIKVTSKYLQDLSISGINKAMTFDMWLFDIRKEWLDDSV